MTLKVGVSFDDLYALRTYVGRIRERHVPTLRLFEDKASRGFKTSQQRPDKSDLSMSSTATCIGSLVQAGLWNYRASESEQLNWWVGREADYYHKLLYQRWQSADLPDPNPFTVGFVVEACAHLEQLNSTLGTDSDETKKREEALTYLCDALTNRKPGDSTPAGSVSVIGYPPSGYLTQLVARSLKRYERLTEDMQAMVTEWALQEISSQLALFSAGSRVADALELAYAITCVMSYCPAYKRTPTDVEIIHSGLKTFFSKQLSNGGWPQSRPLFHYPRYGSAYCFDYETLAQMLLCQELHEPLLQYLPDLGKAAYALEDIKFDLENGALGWASNQTPQLPGPESWSTASVYLFLHLLDRLIAEAIRHCISNELEVPYAGVRQANKEIELFATKFLDCPFSARSGEVETFKPKVFQALVHPLAENADCVKNGQKFPTEVPTSAILFGPPGTSKTEIVEQIADFIGWPMVTVDPSYFVKAGLDQIQAQANRIFRMLSAAEQLVVLFDEFDEMVRNRALSDELLSRFLTTAMLPKLARINKERRILFVVATNYIHTFEVAISRAGRFDLVLQMMPPLASEKMRKWAKELGELKSIVEEAEFDAKLADLTYLETELIARRFRRLGPSPKAELVRELWTDAISHCTLNRANERAAGHTGSPTPIDSEGVMSDHSTSWKVTARQEWS
jgi:hypothetical protein